MVEKSIGDKSLREIQWGVHAGAMQGLPSLSLIPRIENVPDFPSDLEALIDSLSVAALKATERFELNPKSGDAPLPSVEVLKRAVLESVNPEQWEEIQKFKEPVVVLVPEASLLRFKKANSKTCKRPNNAKNVYICDFSEESFQLKAKEIKKDLSDAEKLCFDAGGIIRWNFVITDGAVESAGGKWNKEKWRGAGKEEYRVPTNEERIAAFEDHFNHKGMKRLETPDFICLQICTTQEDKPPMNFKTHALLAEERDGRVAIGSWRTGYRPVGLGSSSGLVHQNRARVPAAVKGHIDT